MNKPEAIQLLFDNASGIYIPQRYANEIDHSMVSGVNPEDIEILRDPEHEYYWETWSDVLDNAEIRIDGYDFTLHQENGDVFLVCQDLMSPQEYSDFYGEEPDESFLANYAEQNGLAVYELPVYWASYLINGDASGLEDGEQAEIDEFTKSENLGFCVDCIGEPSFRYSNDANSLGNDCCYYFFETINQ